MLTEWQAAQQTIRLSDWRRFVSWIRFVRLSLGQLRKYSSYARTGTAWRVRMIAATKSCSAWLVQTS